MPGVVVKVEVGAGDVGGGFFAHPARSKGIILACDDEHVAGCHSKRSSTISAVIVADKLLGFFSVVKLYVQELDSAEFRELAIKASRMTTGSLTRHEVRTVFRRREAEGVLPTGEPAALYDRFSFSINFNVGRRTTS